MEPKAFVHEIREGRDRLRLREWTDTETVELIAFEAEEKLLQLVTAGTTMPIAFDPPGWALFSLMSKVQMLQLFEQLALPDHACVLEVASGDGRTVPAVTELYTKGKGRYITANLNQELTGQFRTILDRLTIAVDIFETNALNLGEHLPPESVDVAVFEHAVNDIIQTTIADQLGIDTVHRNWFDILPAMVEGMARHYENGTLKAAAYPEFIRLMEVVCSLVKPGGFLIINHWTFLYDLELGYPTMLYENFIPLAREWIAEAGLPVEPFEPAGYDPQWWLVLRKKMGRN